MTNLLKVMADHKLDALVHKAVEHQPTLISYCIAPPFTDQKGAPHLKANFGLTPTIVVAGSHSTICRLGFVHRSSLRRRQSDQVRLRLPGDPSSQAAGEHDGAAHPSVVRLVKNFSSGRDLTRPESISSHSLALCCTAGSVLRNTLISYLPSIFRNPSHPALRAGIL